LREGQRNFLVTPRGRGENEHLTLLQRVSVDYRNVQTLVVRSSVLLGLYDQHNQGGNISFKKIEGEDAQSSTTFLDMIERAVRTKSSDLHIEISEENNYALLRYRVDGKLIAMDTIRPASSATDAVMYAYTKLAEKTSRSEPSFNKRKQQSCNIPVTVDGVDYTLRWSSTYKVGGLKVVLRVLVTQPEGEVKTTAELGFEKSQQDLLVLLIRSKGAVPVVGDTGSGKSTSLVTFQNMIPDRESKEIIFIEDPTEYRKAGTTEISIQRSADDTGDPFLAAMRTAMRMDPDVLVPGEIRDSAAASLFEFAVNSGHKGFTTTHASSWIDGINKLASDAIGLSRQVLGRRNFLSGVVCQTLARKLCPHCKLEATDNLDVHTAMLLKAKFSLRLESDTGVPLIFVTNPAGCPKCQHRGVSGRTVIAEVVHMTREILTCIREGRDGDAEEAYRRTRRTAFDDPDMTGKTIFEHGLYKVSQGLVDPIDLVDVLSETYELYEVVEIADIQEKTRPGRAIVVAPARAHAPALGHGQLNGQHYPVFGWRGFGRTQGGL
jgi:general secretion pathway protein E